MASGSESGSEAKTASQAGGESGSKEGKGSGSRGELEGGDKSEGSNSQHSDSGGEVVESCNEAEEPGNESSNSSSELEAVTKKAQLDRKTSEPDPNPSQPISLPELDSKDSEEELKTNHCGFACCMDADFSMWRDKKISEGLKQWDEWDKMLHDHTDPCKEVKHPDPLGAPLDYMESHDIFKPIKTSEYNLCRFSQVGLTGYFPEFPDLMSP